MTAIIKDKQTTATKEEYSAVVCGASAVLFWSVGAYLFCLLKEVPGFQLLAIMQLFGGFLCLRFENRSFSLKSLITRARTGWIFLLLLMINQLSYTWAFRLADAAQVDLLNYLWPTMVLIIEATCRGDRILPRQVFGMIVCFVGIVVLMLPDLKATITLYEFFGYMLALSAALSWSLYTVLARYKGDKKNGTYSIAEDVILLGVCSAVLQLLFGEFKALDFQECYLLVFLAISYYGLAFPFWKRGLECKHYAVVAGFANAVPILSVLWLIGGGISALTPTLFIACILVTIGCIAIGNSEDV